MKGCPIRVSAGIVFVILIVLMMAYVVYGSKHVVDTFEDKKESARCGVDLPPCQGEHVRCMNGYCKSDIAPVMPSLSDLPMAQ